MAMSKYWQSAPYTNDPESFISVALSHLTHLSETTLWRGVIKGVNSESPGVELREPRKNREQEPEFLSGSLGLIVFADTRTKGASGKPKEKY